MVQPRSRIQEINPIVHLVSVNIGYDEMRKCRALEIGITACTFAHLNSLVDVTLHNLMGQIVLDEMSSIL